MKQKLKRAARLLKLTWRRETRFSLTPMKKVEAKGSRLAFTRKQPAIRTETRMMTIALWSEQSRLIA